MRKPRFLVVLLSSSMLAGCIVPSNGRELKTNYPMDLMEIGCYCDQVTAIDNQFSMEIAYGHSYKRRKVLYSPVFPLEEKSVSDRNRMENSVFVASPKYEKECQSIAYVGFCGRAADGHGKPCFEICQMMVFHQSEPPSLL